MAFLQEASMPDVLENTVEILEHLVGFESITGRPTHGIITYIQDYLTAHGVPSSLSFDQAGERTNIVATIGPEVDGGVVMNSHTNVVPVDGQDWLIDPFMLTRRGDRFYGRGSVEMKGFLACVLASVPRFKAAGLKKPIHIAFSSDEEIGGLGMPYLLNSLSDEPFWPGLVIVGEPTGMKIVTGHKGGFEMHTEIVGQAVHFCDLCRDEADCKDRTASKGPGS